MFGPPFREGFFAPQAGKRNVGVDHPYRSGYNRPIVEECVNATVVVPTYNEANNLPALVGELFAQPIENLHLLIVDDGSPDGTGKLAEELAARTPGRMNVMHRTGLRGLGR